MRSLSSIEFKRDFVDTFDGDHSGNLNSRQTPGMLYSRAVPSPVSNPSLLAWSDDLAQQLGIQKPESPEDVNILSGNQLNPSMFPYAACYAGHQFGHWAGQLGDGRAITLGELNSPEGTIWELQLKGAGRTPYSRSADGRAVLRSSIREFLMSEAMFYLGVPTTRALSLVSTGDPVLRDMFYDGHPQYEPGAIVARMAPSFLRFGNFEILAARGEIENLKKLTDWTIRRYYPEIEGDDRVLQFFKQVVRRTAFMITEWERVGFVHGVMNTDNMSVLGLTIDYGPFSFLDEFDLSFTPNTTDLPGRRYAFGQQAYIAQWNLSCFAGALAPLFSNSDQLMEELNAYKDSYQEMYYFMMARKLGLEVFNAEDKVFVDELEKNLAAIKPDMSIFYQLLIDLPEDNLEKRDLEIYFQDSFYQIPAAEDLGLFHQLMRKYQTRLQRNSRSKEETKRAMAEANPRFILRNYLLHQSIVDAEKGDYNLLAKLQEAIKTPYSGKADEFFSRRPDWAANQAGCSMLSCSS